jgi:hypothetical protein
MACSRVTPGSFNPMFPQNWTWTSRFIQLFLFHHKCKSYIQDVPAFDRLWRRFMIRDLPVAGCHWLKKPEQASPFAPLPFSNFLTTTSWSATATSDHPFACLSPFRLQDSSDFSCSLQTPVEPSCQLYPGCCMTTKQVAHHTLIAGIYVNAHFQHHLLPLRGFSYWFKFFSSAPRTCGNQVSAFPYRSPPKVFPPSAA